MSSQRLLIARFLRRIHWILISPTAVVAGFMLYQLRHSCLYGLCHCCSFPKRSQNFQQRAHRHLLYFCLYSGCNSNCKPKLILMCVKNTTRCTGITSALCDSSVGYLTVKGRTNRGKLMEKRHGCPIKLARLSQNFARWPQFCCFCHRKTDTGYDLCRYCHAFLPALVQNSGSKTSTSVCLGCGFVWSDAILRSKCANCVKASSRIRQIICPFRYDFPIDGLIGRLKYQTHLPTGRILGNLLAKKVRQQLKPDQYPDLILPVPVSAARYRTRGFNQAAEIAHWCGRSIGVRSHPAAAGRRIDTGSLVGLSRAERGLRIRGAFWADEQLYGRNGSE